MVGDRVVDADVDETDGRGDAREADHPGLEEGATVRGVPAAVLRGVMIAIPEEGEATPTKRGSSHSPSPAKSDVSFPKLSRKATTAPRDGCGAAPAETPGGAATAVGASTEARAANAPRPARRAALGMIQGVGWKVIRKA